LAAREKKKHQTDPVGLRKKKKGGERREEREFFLLLQERGKKERNTKKGKVKELLGLLRKKRGGSPYPSLGKKKKSKGTERGEL